MAVLLHQFWILSILNFTFFSLLEVHKGICFLLGLTLHQKHSSLVCLFDLLRKLFFFHLLQLCLLFFLLFILIDWFSLCFSNSLLFKVSLFFLLPSLIFFLFGELLARCHNSILLSIDGFFKLFFLLDIGLSPPFLFLFLFFPHIFEFLLKLIKCHFLK